MKTIGIEITILFIVTQLFMLMWSVGLADESRVFSPDPIKFYPQSESCVIDSTMSFTVFCYSHRP